MLRDILYSSSLCIVLLVYMLLATRYLLLVFPLLSSATKAGCSCIDLSLGSILHIYTPVHIQNESTIACIPSFDDSSNLAKYHPPLAPLIQSPSYVAPHRAASHPRITQLLQYMLHFRPSPRNGIKIHLPGSWASFYSRQYTIYIC